MLRFASPDFTYEKWDKKWIGKMLEEAVLAWSFQVAEPLSLSGLREMLGVVPESEMDRLFTECVGELERRAESTRAAARALWARKEGAGK